MVVEKQKARRSTTKCRGMEMENLMEACEEHCRGMCRGLGSVTLVEAARGGLVASYLGVSAGLW